MTAILDRIPVDRITAEARRVDSRRIVLTLVAAVLYGVGWLAARIWEVVGVVLIATWRGLVWASTAVKVGWVDARSRTRGTA